MRFTEPNVRTNHRIFTSTHSTTPDTFSSTLRRVYALPTTAQSTSATPPKINLSPPNQPNLARNSDPLLPILAPPIHHHKIPPTHPLHYLLPTNTLPNNRTHRLNRNPEPYRKTQYRRPCHLRQPSPPRPGNRSARLGDTHIPAICPVHTGLPARWRHSRSRILQVVSTRR